MENVRFHPEEEMSYIKNPEKVGAFRNFLSSMCDTFVNDAFGCLHRAHSSIVGVNAPQKAAGILVERELQYIGPIAFNQDQRISLLILGGAKVSDKIALISSLVPRTDRIYIGGAMVLTFMSVYNPNFHLGSSRIEPGCDSHVNNIISAIKDNGTRLFLPTDFKIADSLDDPVRMDTISIHDEFGIPDQMMALDIGPSSIVELDKLVRETPDGGIVLWNGPMGVFEKDPFSAGTRGLVSALSGSTPRITSIVGGGDSASAVNLFGDVSKMSHVSTGGGATLELLEGKILPGLSFLQS